MKRNRLFIVSLILLLVVGCASTPATIAYRTIATVKAAVDIGMQGWADRVIDGKATLAQQAQVKAAFEKYTSAAAAAAAVMRASSDPAPVNLTAAADALLQLLAAFGVKGGS